MGEVLRDFAQNFADFVCLRYFGFGSFCPYCKPCLLCLRSMDFAVAGFGLLALSVASVDFPQSHYQLPKSAY